jgi:hypothetical protein
MKNQSKLYLFLIILISIFTCFSCNNEDDDIFIEEKTLQFPPNENIKSFIFSASVNNLREDMVGIYDENTSQIRFVTQKLIRDIDKLIPTFEVEGTIKVNGEVQKSGVSSHSYLTPVTYTVKGIDNTEKEYTVVFESPQTSGLPVLIIDTDNNSPIISKEKYIKADIKTFDPNNNKYNIDTRTEIRGRGNSTWRYSKKPYRLKFFEKTSLFGYPAEKSWVLIANWLDPTLIMNTVAFEYGYRLGLPYTNHSTHVEVFINGNYEGNYMLTEQIQAKENRVDINKQMGFLVELDSYYDAVPKFRTKKLNLPVMIKSPEEGDIQFVKDDLNALEASLFDPAFPNTDYQDMININMLIDYMLISEIVKNQEIQGPKSVYMYKKDQTPGAKICLGPLWDYDWAFGYSGQGKEFTYFFVPDQMILNSNYKGNQNGYKFFCRFLDDPDFRTRYKARWNKLYMANKLNMNSFIDKLANNLHKSHIQNFKRWPNGMIYEDEISKMKEWLNDRIEYLNKEINKY